MNLIRIEPSISHLQACNLSIPFFPFILIRVRSLHSITIGAQRKWELYVYVSVDQKSVVATFELL